MKYLSLILFLALLCTHSVAQVTITGKVTAQDGNPVPFANVLLLHDADSTLVKGTIANENGTYQIASIQRGNYLLRVSSIGYATFNSPAFQLTQDRPSIDFGTQIIQEDSRQLDEVVIRADKPLYQQELDKTIINVQSSALTKGSTVLEVLERSPGIVIDRQSNNIVLNGKKGVGVLINGKFMRLSAAEISNMLNGMSANNIEKIEIMTSPPAKYDAEGVAGLINIIVKKDESYGTNGSVSITGGYGLFAKSVAGASINHRSEKINAYANYSYTYDKTTNELRARGAFEFPYEPENTNRTSNYLNRRTPIKNLHNATIGLDYSIDKNTTVGISSFLAANFQTAEGYTYSEYSVFGDSLLIFGVDMNEKNNWQNIINNVNIERTLGKNSKVNFNVDYIYNNNLSPSTYKNHFLDRHGNDIAQQWEGFVEGQRVENRVPMHIVVYSADYENKLKSNITFQAGVKASGSRIENSLTVWSIENGEEKRVTDVSQNMKMSEDIMAAYSSFDINLNKTDVTMGLRYEYTKTEVGYNANTQSGVYRKYGNFFPTVVMRRKFTEESSGQIAYNRRISRPAFTSIAPIVTFNDMFSIYLGNPALKPILTDNIQASFQHKDFNFSLQYTRDKNQIIDYQHVESPSDSIFYIKSLNMKSQESIMAQASFPIQVNRWWRIQNSVGAGWRQFETLDIVEGNFDKSLLLCNIYSSQSFQLPNNTFFEISGYYYSPDYNGQYKRKGFGGVNLGVKMELKNNLGTVLVSLPDPLKLAHYRLYMEPGLAPYGLTSNIDIIPESRRAMVVKVTYSKSFGNNKVKGRRNLGAGSRDEQNRIRN